MPTLAQNGAKYENNYAKCEESAAKYPDTLFVSHILRAFHNISQKVYSRPKEVITTVTRR